LLCILGLVPLGMMAYRQVRLPTTPPRVAPSQGQLSPVVVPAARLAAIGGVLFAPGRPALPRGLTVDAEACATANACAVPRPARLGGPLGAGSAVALPADRAGDGTAVAPRRVTSPPSWPASG
jgi:hypothetical protein